MILFFNFIITEKQKTFTPAKLKGE